MKDIKNNKYKCLDKEFISINTQNFLNTIKSSELPISLETDFNCDKDMELIINKYIYLKRQMEKIINNN